MNRNSLKGLIRMGKFMAGCFGRLIRTRGHVRKFVKLLKLQGNIPDMGFSGHVRTPDQGVMWIGQGGGMETPLRGFHPSHRDTPVNPLSVGVRHEPASEADVEGRGSEGGSADGGVVSGLFPGWSGGAGAGSPGGAGAGAGIRLDAASGLRTAGDPDHARGGGRVPTQGGTGRRQRGGNALVGSWHRPGRARNLRHEAFADRDAGPGRGTGLR